MPNPEPDPNDQMEKTAHISFHITGPDVDKIDWLMVIQNELDDDCDFTVTHGNVNIYYKGKSYAKT